jgi:hypothetical protein
VRRLADLARYPIAAAWNLAMDLLGKPDNTGCRECCGPDCPTCNISTGETAS